MKILSHRGSPNPLLENRLPAINQAILDGLHGVEVDLQISKDRTIFLSHDDNLKRCYGQDINISRSTKDYVAKQKVPTLSDLFQMPIGTQLHLEIKHHGIAMHLIRRFKSELIARANYLYVTSFLHDEVRYLKKRIPEISTGALWVGQPIWPIPINICEMSFADAIVMPMETEMVDMTFVENMHSHGYKVFCWGVKNILDIRRAQNMKIDLVYSDAPVNEALKTAIKRAD